MGLGVRLWSLQSQYELWADAFASFTLYSITKRYNTNSAFDMKWDAAADAWRENLNEYFERIVTSKILENFP